MASSTTTHDYATRVLILACFVSMFSINPTIATGRKLTALVREQPLVLKYHNGLLLKGNVAVNLVWYGQFTPAQRTIVVDFIQSLSPAGAASAPPSVASWWKVTERYKGGQTNLHLGKQLFDESCSLGKSLKSADLPKLAAGAGAGAGITAVLTAEDVTVEGFCMSRCGTHGSAPVASGKDAGRFAYLWVGNPESQCAGQCAWPFHQPLYGPQTPPLVAPNADVGVDGMIINLATVLAGAATNPYNSGYFQGPATAPLEAVSACTGKFGSGAYPGYPGKVLVDGASGGSYNAKGLNGRKYLLPAIWDPKTSTCSTPA